MYIPRRGRRRVPNYQMPWAKQREPVHIKSDPNMASEQVRQMQKGKHFDVVVGCKMVQGLRWVSSRVISRAARSGLGWMGHMPSVVLGVMRKMSDAALRGTKRGRYVRITQDEAEFVCFWIVVWIVCMAAFGWRLMCRIFN